MFNPTTKADDSSTPVRPSDISFSLTCGSDDPQDQNCITVVKHCWDGDHTAGFPEMQNTPQAFQNADNMVACPPKPTTNVASSNPIPPYPCPSPSDTSGGDHVDDIQSGLNYSNCIYYWRTHQPPGSTPSPNPSISPTPTKANPITKIKSVIKKLETVNSPSPTPTTIASLSSNLQSKQQNNLHQSLNELIERIGSFFEGIFGLIKF